MCRTTRAIVVTEMLSRRIFRLAQEIYGDWPRAEDPFIQNPLVEHPPSRQERGGIIKSPSQNVIIDIAWHGPSIVKDNDATMRRTVLFYSQTTELAFPARTG